MHVMQMCAAFAETGHRVDLILPDRHRESEPGVLGAWEYYGVPRAFEIYRVPWPARTVGTRWVFAVCAVRQARSLSPDLVYTRSLATAFVAGMAGLPVVLEAHQPVIVSGRFASVALLMLTRQSSFRGLVVITRALAAVYEQRYRGLRGRIHVVPDAARPVDPSTVPVDLGARQERLQVGYAGQLYEGRGIQRILDLAEALPNIDFSLVGGSDGDVARWKALAASLPNVRFIGFVAPSAVPQYLLAFDVLIAPYESRVVSAGGHETTRWMSPLKLFEYLAASKPIVATDLPALREVVDEDCGVTLCAYDDFTCWVEALSRLATSPELRARLGSQALARFSDSYSWRARAARLTQIVAEL